MKDKEKTKEKLITLQRNIHSRQTLKNMIAFYLALSE